MAALPTTAVVVLDVDDTLYLERSYVKSGFAAVGRRIVDRFGIDGVGVTLWTGFEAGVRGDAFDRALGAHGMEPTAELVTELVTCYRSHKPDIELLPDARRFLEATIGRRFGVITDGPPASQQAKVDALDLHRWVEKVVLTGELGEGLSKPHPAGYEAVEQHHGAAATDCVYIADNPTKDFVTPLKRGWGAVRIRRPGGLHENLPTPDGVAEITSFDELALNE